MKKIAILIFIVTVVCNAQTTVTYKEIGQIQLNMDIYYPDHMDLSKTYPAMVFFFGGGWKTGSISQFEHHAQYFSKRGLVCFLVDYRIESRQHTTPFESVKDAKSSMRYIREHAKEFHIDPDKIIASGGSAGGHLAAATALIDEYNENTDNLSISCMPNALVLFNPVIDISPGSYGFSRIGADEYKNFSPLHNVSKVAPPTIFFLGTEDHLVPVAAAQYFKMAMNRVNSRCDLKLYDGEKHSFFNYTFIDNYKQTVKETDLFLQSLGYLSKTPCVEIK
ncbi:Acetyl esterase/lipase [Flaviramulus basaltis]|uniref:Acetyl esterase/lipase n=1 Tax=Flaviramulus basaltis TaxID=369401 RepID=A0A1K2IMC6_9FLAO|nr:alpha/beta hydrolase [Flaviramulus basaltis]SFZ93593.1 Acetyl esterase/lipase [Flaviramulus basaltis]